MTTFKWNAGAVQTLLTTELDSLANGSTATDSAVYDNATNLYLYAEFELTAAFGSAPAAGTTIELYLVPQVDGSNDVDSTAGSSEATHYVGSFILKNSGSATRYYLGSLSGRGQIILPPVPFKAKIKNSSGQAMAASGNTLKMVPYSLQSV